MSENGIQRYNYTAPAGLLYFDSIKKTKNSDDEKIKKKQLAIKTRNNNNYKLYTKNINQVISEHVSNNMETAKEFTKMRLEYIKNSSIEKENIPKGKLVSGRLKPLCTFNINSPSMKTCRGFQADIVNIHININYYTIFFNQIYIMPSDAKKRKDLLKREQAKKRMQQNNKQHNANSNKSNGNVAINSNKDEKKDIDQLVKKMETLDIDQQFRSTAGVNASHPQSRDLHVHSLSLRFHGKELLLDTKLELNYGRRYALIGENGCGKSTLLKAINARETPMSDHLDVYYVNREMEPVEKTAIDCVMDVDKERFELESYAEQLIGDEDDEAVTRLSDIYERLDELDSSTARPKAASILFGLGFTNEMQNTAAQDFSGGWRMRIALARALFISPSILLLDEPTNHLDLNSCVWLEHELQKFKRILLIISHSQDFMNGVCTNVILMKQKRLDNFKGNYDQYVQTQKELNENQMKQYKWEQDQIAHMKNYIARFGHGSAKLARQAQSKEKTLKKMIDKGLTEKITERHLNFDFFDCGTIPPPVISVKNISFRYSDSKPYIYKNVEFGLDLDVRIALVGPNGAGKSTLLKLIADELSPTDGLIQRHSHLKIGRYHQHLQDHLNLDMTALDWMMKEYPEIKEPEQMRRILGRYGISGLEQVCPMTNLSDGQRCRVVFAWLAWRSPHMLLMDEPTNHLDIETIDSLATALNRFNGGLMLVSHDFRLISQVAQEIWVCENGNIKKWDGDILSYKKSLVKLVIN
ncbi:hypothetical protein A3Q56_07115 [Intoshia linei]|uniref:ABC transporter domain-containing protein n=1 Tax=Intoshia linei TaxID=1819745 RepID=A0A177AUU8_9BILA|nr:hypothetical protein A3Q56_07115 [Intoshia linei]